MVFAHVIEMIKVNLAQGCTVVYELLHLLPQIGIIGGSGFDDPDILHSREEKTVDTPFGQVRLVDSCSSE